VTSVHIVLVCYVALAHQWFSAWCFTWSKLIKEVKFLGHVTVIALTKRVTKHDLRIRSNGVREGSRDEREWRLPNPA
jgi:hypothetical protein